LLDFKIVFLDEVDSTHKYLKQYIKQHNYAQPIAIVTQNQTDGIGSRNNTWEGKEGNLFFSFVVSKDYLPLDLLIQSSSIYFSYLFKDILQQQGSNVWLKWPNDFYIDDKKIGGTITSYTNNLLYCGIGLNLVALNNQYGQLDIKIDINKILQSYFKIISQKILWKQIFSKYSIEFDKSKQYKATIDNQKIFLSEAILNYDGSINIKDKKVYSLR